MAALRERILVVNDEPAIVEVLTAILEDEGLEAVGATGADQAVAAVKDGFRPHVVLTDLMMPVHSGEALIEALRARPETRDVPIVAMSASPTQLDAVRGKVQGRLEKPFTVEALVDLLSACCKQGTKVQCFRPAAGLHRS